MASSTRASNTGGFYPFVASGPHSGVRNRPVQELFGCFPRTARHQPDQDPPKTDLVGDTRIVASEGMAVLALMDQSLHRFPHRVCYFGLERAHNEASTSWGVACTRYQTRENPSTGGFPHLPAGALSRENRRDRPPSRAHPRHHPTMGCERVPPGPLQGRPLQTEMIPYDGRATSDPRPPGAWHLPICQAAVTRTTPSYRKSFASPKPAHPCTLL